MCTIPEGRGYRHEPLCFSKPAIRLLSINPVDEAYLLTCNLRAYELESCPCYTALSYEWGDQLPLVEVVINGRSLGIRHNLWLFLSTLKEKQKRKELPTDLHLWIDALCINQRDLSERSAQVSMMGSIYRNATSVFAWLGWPQGWDPKVTFAFITKEYFRLFENSTDIGAWWDRRKFNEQIQMVLTMCRCRYWSRRWILQEILLAREIWLLCGDNELSWLWFTRFLRQLELFRELASQQQIDIGAMVADFRTTTAFTISRYKDDEANYEQQSIVKLLREFRATDCEVLHDKVYSLLGLATSGSSISVDYSCSPRDLVYKLMLLNDSGLNEDFRFLVKEFGPVPNNSGLVAERSAPSNSVFSFAEEIFSITAQISSCTPPLSNEAQILLRELARRDQVLAPHSTFPIPDRLIEATHRCSVCAQRQSRFPSDNGKGYNAQEVNEGSFGGIMGSIRLPSTSFPAGYGKFFTCGDGSIGLSCLNAMAGDFLCDFDCGRRLVVGLQHENDWRLIGTATCNHIFGMIEDAPALLGTIAKSVVEREQHIDFLRPGFSLDSSTIADVLLQREAQVLNNVVSFLMRLQFFSRRFAMEKEFKRTKLALPFRDLIGLALEQAGLIDFPLMDDRYQFNKRIIFSTDFDESGGEKGYIDEFSGEEGDVDESNGEEGHIDESSGEEGDID